MKKLLAILMLLPVVAGAQWSTDPANPLLVTGEPGSQASPITVADDEGGCFVVWTHSGSTTDEWRIFAQHFDEAGIASWPAGGMRVCTYESKQSRAVAVADGSGGIFVAWTDESVGVTDNSNIYAQRLSSAGRLWITDGRAVCTTVGDQSYAALSTDGEGGCFVTWWDERSGESDVYAQRLNSSGVKVWTSLGVVVCDATGTQSSARIAPDDEGGFICCWVDYRTYSEGRITGQRFDASGSALWTANGVGFGTVYLGHPTVMREIIADGLGGFFLCRDKATYEDYEYKYDSYVQHIDSDGLNLFSSTSLEIAGELGYNGNASLAADGEGGVYAAAAYDGDSYRDRQVRFQHFTSDGQRLWGYNGLTGASDADLQYGPRLAEDGLGGIVVSWYDSRSGDQFAYAQRLNAAGLKLWPDDDVLICTTTGTDSQSPALLAGGGWVKTVQPQYGDIHIQKLGPYGYLDDPRPAITSVQDVPNDQGGEVTVHWDASWLDSMAQRQVNEYSVWMRSPEVKGAILTDEAAVKLAEERGWPAAEVDAFNKAGWGYVAQVPALLEPEYFAFAPTFGDSTGAGIPYTEYRVVAHSDEIWISWECLSEVGYSVDNLEPGAPLELAATRRTDGSVDLTWEASGLNDEDLANYVLYGGLESSFALDAAHLLGSVPGTFFNHDPGTGLHYYRVTARDAHGNEGSGSNEAKVPAVSAVPEMTPVVALHANWPNPFNPTTLIAFDLPQGGHAELAVYSVNGRRVRTLLNGYCEPGRHQRYWDGRDESGRGVSAGVYYYRLQAGDFRSTRSMVLVK